MTIPRHEMASDFVRARPGALALALAVLATTTPLGAQGTIRELDCRGNTGMVLRVEQDPSPRDTAAVTMVLEYKRAASATGGDSRTLDPGTCSWNPGGWAGFPVEPGRVRFDVPREAQPYSATETRMMDTTARAAVFFADPITLPRYLLDPKHYWKFYVDDQTDFSPSSQALFESGTPTYVWITGPVVAAGVRRDLLCRGGTSGLLWGGGASAGNNLAKVLLSYRVSPNVPGATGRALAPGSCAWTDRTAMPPEPGRIWFITASNAQIRQAQSGTIDRSPTAAERYPDVRSIPVYLQDPAHFWTFSVMSRVPDSALTNGPWKADLANVVAGARAGATTTRTQATTGPGSGTFRPGAGNTTSQVQSVFDIRNVTVTPGLEGVAIKFEAAANSSPTVTLTPAGGGAPIQLTVGSSAGSAGMMRYAAASTTKLPRDARFNYVIAAPATAQARANQTTGAFKTLGQYLTVVISRIDILSDGDKEGNGELSFKLGICPDFPRLVTSDLPTKLDWTEGPQPTKLELKSKSGDTPDQVRIVPWMYEDDYTEGASLTYSRLWAPDFACNAQRAVDPGRHADGEWNSTPPIDIDLTKYPGAKAGGSFVRRSKPLARGSTVSFEVRGSFLVTRN